MSQPSNWIVLNKFNEYEYVIGEYENQIDTFVTEC